MAKIKYLFFAVLALLLFSTPGSAFKDTVEIYTDYSDLWVSDIDSYYGSGSVSIVQYPASPSWNHCLKLTSSSAQGGGYALTSITTKEPVYYDYIGFNLMDSICVLENPSYPNSYCKAYATIQLVNGSGQVVAESTFSDSGVYELFSIGNDIFLYHDGVQVGGDISNGFYDRGTAYHVLIGTYVYSKRTAGSTYAYIWIDDISTGACIGSPIEWTELSDNIECSFRLQDISNLFSSNYTVQVIELTGDNIGEKNTTEIITSTGVGFMSWNRDTVFKKDYGVYQLNLYNDNILYDVDYFVYSSSTNPITLPNVLFLAGSNVDMDIRDNFAEGGTIDGGGLIYLYPNIESGNYQFTYSLQNNELSFRSTIETLYGNSDINSSLIKFTGLQNSYLVNLNGAQLPGISATGNFTFSGNLSDGDLLNISGDCYEFDNNSSTLPGSIPVSLDSSNKTISVNNLLANITANGTANITASIAPSNTTILFITANTAGADGNLISISSNSINITASGTHLTGGVDSAGITNGPSWSYNITDWSNTSKYIFEFSPDLTKPGIYGYVKDADTQQPLRTSTITIFNDSVSYILWTDSNGMYYKTADLPPGQRYSVKAAKNRYVTFESIATISDGATTQHDIFLSPEEGAGLYYAPHDVTFTVWEYWNSGAGLPGVSYAVYNSENELIKTGITDSEGSFVVEEMDTGTRYKIIITYNEQTYTEFYEPGASSYTIILNKENIIHEYYNNWLNLTYEESAGCVNVSYLSNEAISQTSLIATASNGTTVYSETLTTDSGNFTFSYPEGDYIISFTAVTASGLTASQSWTVSYSTSAQLFPSSYPDWLKNLLYVAIILIFLLAFGKARNDIACGSAAVLTSIGYYFNWLVCSFSFVILIWIISLGAVFVHYKRTKGTG